MSVFAASSWAAVAAVAHQLERDAAGLEAPVALTLRGFARRLHAARLLARHVFTALEPPGDPAADSAEEASPHVHDGSLQREDTWG